MLWAPFPSRLVFLLRHRDIVYDQKFLLALFTRTPAHVYRVELIGSEDRSLLSAMWTGEHANQPYQANQAQDKDGVRSGRAFARTML